MGESRIRVVTDRGSTSERLLIGEASKPCTEMLF